MKSTVLLFQISCIYEIVILNYFLNCTGKEVEFVSLDGKPITAMEGYSMNVSKKLEECNLDEIELMIIPGGNIQEIDRREVWDVLNELYKKGKLIAGICAGVDVLDHAGILSDVKSTHSCEEDVVVSDHIITARANAYVDFAIETAKKMDLFKDEADLNETISFWKEFKRVQ